MRHRDFFDIQRRDLLKLGLYGSAAGLLAPFAGGFARAQSETTGKRILVVLELSGGNDGLNTVAPYGDDAYYGLRPQIGIRKEKLRPIDDHYGLNRGMAGMEKLWADGKLAVVHGVGYAQPSFSHFNSMAYWHTAAPNSGAAYGWVGRLADVLLPPGTPNAIINIDATQSLAVRAENHVPVVFDDPTRFAPKGPRHADAIAEAAERNVSRAFLNDVARAGQQASEQVQAAWARYPGAIDYGLADLDLPKIAALIEADMPTRLYYTSFRNNAFDTHVHQPNLHGRLLTYFSDAVFAFQQDLERMGRDDDVTLLVFSEFGRRAGENTNRGTDHGTANLMFAIGSGVRGGHHGTRSDLVDLDESGNLVHTTDFRQVLASAIEGWLGHPNAADVLGREFTPLDLFT